MNGVQDWDIHLLDQEGGPPGTQSPTHNASQVLKNPLIQQNRDVMFQRMDSKWRVYQDYKRISAVRKEIEERYGVKFQDGKKAEWRALVENPATTEDVKTLGELLGSLVVESWKEESFWGKSTGDYPETVREESNLPTQLKNYIGFSLSLNYFCRVMARSPSSRDSILGVNHLIKGKNVSSLEKVMRRLTCVRYTEWGPGVEFRGFRNFKVVNLNKGVFFIPIGKTKSTSHGLLIEHDYMLMISELHLQRMNCMIGCFINENQANPWYDAAIPLRADLLQLYSIGDHVISHWGNDGYRFLKKWEGLVFAKMIDLTNDSILRAMTPDYFEDIFEEVLDKLPDFDKCSKCMDAKKFIEEKSEIPMLWEMFGLFRQWGHPHIDLSASAEKYKKVGRSEKNFQKKELDEIECLVKLDFLQSYRQRFKTYPALDVGQVPEGYLKTRLERNLVIDENDFNFNTSDLMRLSFKQTFDRPTVRDLLNTFEDKSSTINKSQVLENLPKSHGKSSENSVVNMLLFSTDYIDNWDEKLRNFEEEGFSKEDLIVRLKVKERELKTEGRYFGILGFKAKTMMGVMNNLVKKHILSLKNEITYGKSEVELARDSMDFLAKINRDGQSEKVISLTAHLDIEKFNESFRRESTGLVSKLADQLFGLNNVNTRFFDFFEQSLKLQSPPETDVYKSDIERGVDNNSAWTYSKGGIQGILQSHWTWITSVLVKHCSKEVPGSVLHEGQGDNQVITWVYKTSHPERVQTDEKVVFYNKVLQAVQAMEESFRKIGLTIKLEESNITKDLRNYGKECFLGSTKLRHLLKRIAPFKANSDVFIGSFLQQMGKVTAVCDAAVGHSNLPLIPRVLASFWTSITFLFCWLDHPLEDGGRLFGLGLDRLSLHWRRWSIRASWEVRPSEKDVAAFLVENLSIPKINEMAGTLFYLGGLLGCPSQPLGSSIILSDPDTPAQLYSELVIVTTRIESGDQIGVPALFRSPLWRSTVGFSFGRFLSTSSDPKSIVFDAFRSGFPPMISVETIVHDHTKKFMCGRSSEVSFSLLREALGQKFTNSVEEFIKLGSKSQVVFPRVLETILAGSEAQIGTSFIKKYTTPSSLVVRSSAAENAKVSGDVLDRDKVTFLLLAHLQVGVPERTKRWTLEAVGPRLIARREKLLGLTKDQEALGVLSLPLDCQFDLVELNHGDCEICSEAKNKERKRFIFVRHHRKGKSPDTLIKSEGQNKSFIGTRTSEKGIKIKGTSEDIIDYGKTAIALAKMIGFVVQPESNLSKLIAELINYHFENGDEIIKSYSGSCRGTPEHRMRNARKSMGGMANFPTNIMTHFSWSTNPMNNNIDGNKDLIVNFSKIVLHACWRIHCRYDIRDMNSEENSDWHLHLKPSDVSVVSFQEGDIEISEEDCDKMVELLTGSQPLLPKQVFDFKFQTGNTGLSLNKNVEEPELPREEASLSFSIGFWIRAGSSSQVPLSVENWPPELTGSLGIGFSTKVRPVSVIEGWFFAMVVERIIRDVKTDPGFVPWGDYFENIELRVTQKDVLLLGNLLALKSSRDAIGSARPDWIFDSAVPLNLNVVESVLRNAASSMMSQVTRLFRQFLPMLRKLWIFWNVELGIGGLLVSAAVEMAGSLSQGEILGAFLVRDLMVQLIRFNPAAWSQVLERTSVLERVCPGTSAQWGRQVHSNFRLTDFNLEELKNTGSSTRHFLREENNPLENLPPVSIPAKSINIMGVKLSGESRDLAEVFMRGLSDLIDSCRSWLFKSKNRTSSFLKVQEILASKVLQELGLGKTPISFLGCGDGFGGCSLVFIREFYNIMESAIVSTLAGEGEVIGQMNFEQSFDILKNSPLGELEKFQEWMNVSETFSGMMDGDVLSRSFWEDLSRVSKSRNFIFCDADFGFSDELKECAPIKFLNLMTGYVRRGFKPSETIWVVIKVFIHDLENLRRWGDEQTGSRILLMRCPSTAPSSSEFYLVIAGRVKSFTIVTKEEQKSERVDSNLMKLYEDCRTWGFEQQMNPSYVQDIRKRSAEWSETLEIENPRKDDWISIIKKADSQTACAFEIGCLLADQNPPRFMKKSSQLSSVGVGTMSDHMAVRILILVVGGWIESLSDLPTIVKSVIKEGGLIFWRDHVDGRVKVFPVLNKVRLNVPIPTKLMADVGQMFFFKISDKYVDSSQVKKAYMEIARIRDHPRWTRLQSDRVVALRVPSRRLNRIIEETTEKFKLEKRTIVSEVGEQDILNTRIERSLVGNPMKDLLFGFIIKSTQGQWTLSRPWEDVREDLDEKLNELVEAAVVGCAGGDLRMFGAAFKRIRSYVRLYEEMSKQFDEFELPFFVGEEDVMMWVEEGKRKKRLVCPFVLFGELASIEVISGVSFYNKSWILVLSDIVQGVMELHQSGKIALPVSREVRKGAFARKNPSEMKVEGTLQESRVKSLFSGTDRTEPGKWYDKDMGLTPFFFSRINAMQRTGVGLKIYLPNMRGGKKFTLIECKNDAVYIEGLGEERFYIGGIHTLLSCWSRKQDGPKELPSPFEMYWFWESLPRLSRELFIKLRDSGWKVRPEKGAIIPLIHPRLFVSSDAEFSVGMGSKSSADLVLGEGDRCFRCFGGEISFGFRMGSEK